MKTMLMTAALSLATTVAWAAPTTVRVLAVSMEKGEKARVDPRLSKETALVRQVQKNGYNQVSLAKDATLRLEVGATGMVSIPLAGGKPAKLSVTLLSREGKDVRLRVVCKELRARNLETTHERGGAYVLAAPQANLAVALQPKL